MTKTLSKTERIVYEHMIAGRSNKAIADLIFTTEKTVKQHGTAIYRKCGVKSRYELMAKHYKETEKWIEERVRIECAVREQKLLEQIKTLEDYVFVKPGILVGGSK